jgi:hypothetical protein
MDADVLDKALAALDEIKVKPDNEYKSCVNCKHVRPRGRSRYGKTILICSRENNDKIHIDGKFLGTCWDNELIHKNTRYELKTKEFKSDNYFNHRCEFHEFQENWW